MVCRSTVVCEMYGNRHGTCSHTHTDTHVIPHHPASTHTYSLSFIYTHPPHTHTRNSLPPTHLFSLSVSHLYIYIPTTHTPICTSTHTHVTGKSKRRYSCLVTSGATLEKNSREKAGLFYFFYLLGLGDWNSSGMTWYNINSSLSFLLQARTEGKKINTACVMKMDDEAIIMPISVSRSQII